MIAKIHDAHTMGSSKSALHCAVKEQVPLVVGQFEIQADPAKRCHRRFNPDPPWQKLAEVKLIHQPHF
jgi:hypothetical protein